MFNRIKGIDNLNYTESLYDIKELFSKISKSIGFSFFKPAVFLSVPEELNSSNWSEFRDKLSEVILDSGWSKVYFVEELMTAAVGCDLPYNKLKNDGLYAKRVFIYGKKNSVTFGVGCAGGTFEKCVFPFSLTNIDHSTFENIINRITRSDIEIPDSFVNRPYSEDIKNKLRLSWEADVDKTICLMAPEDEKSNFINKMNGFKFFAPSGYESFITLGLEKIIKTVVEN